MKSGGKVQPLGGKRCENAARPAETDVNHKAGFLQLEASGRQWREWLFLWNFATVQGMEKEEHAKRLRQAMARTGTSRVVIADLVGKTTRTVTNWTTGHAMPDPADRAKLRRLLGDYDDPGDPVELAVRNSRLTEDRQYVVLGTYKRQLREQDEDEGRRGA